MFQEMGKRVVSEHDPSEGQKQKVHFQEQSRERRPEESAEELQRLSET